MAAISKIFRKNRKVNVTLEVEKSPEEICVQGYMDAINRHAGLEELLAFYVSDQAKIYFEDGLTVSAKRSCETFQQLYRCFPDIQWLYDSVEPQKNGSIVVNETRARGTHTGEPFVLFGKDEKTVQPTGKKFENDPARFFFKVEQGKIKSITVVALGTKTGPVGIYEDLTSTK